MRSVYQKLRVLLLSIVIAGIAMASTGCVAAILGAAAAGGAVGYAYYQGNIYRDYPTSLLETRAAAFAALKDLQLPILTQHTTATNCEIESATATGERVTVHLKPGKCATCSSTIVQIRVGLFGDHDISRYLHDRMAVHLRLPPGMLQQLNGPHPKGSRHVALPSTVEPPLAQTPQTSPPPTHLPPVHAHRVPQGAFMRDPLWRAADGPTTPGQ